MLNSRRIAQPIPRNTLRRERRELAQRLAEKGMPVPQTWGPLGYMANRASWPSVRNAVERSMRDSDPIAGALEILAQAEDA